MNVRFQKLWTCFRFDRRGAKPDINQKYRATLRLQYCSLKNKRKAVRNHINTVLFQSLSYFFESRMKVFEELSTVQLPVLFFLVMLAVTLKTGVSTMVKLWEESEDYFS